MKNFQRFSLVNDESCNFLDNLMWNGLNFRMNFDSNEEDLYKEVLDKLGYDYAVRAEAYDKLGRQIPESHGLYAGDGFDWDQFVWEKHLLISRDFRPEEHEDYLWGVLSPVLRGSQILSWCFYQQDKNTQWGEKSWKVVLDCFEDNPDLNAMYKLNWDYQHKKYCLKPMHPPHKELEVFDVTTLKGGELVSYTTFETGKGFYLETGEVRGENLYKDGVFVFGKDWKQYAQKWHIQKVVKDGKVLFEREE